MREKRRKKQKNSLTDKNIDGEIVKNEKERESDSDRERTCVSV